MHDRFNDNAVKKKKGIDFSETYIFNDKYIYQTNKSINDAEEQIIKGFIPEKLKHLLGVATISIFATPFFI